MKTCGDCLFWLKVQQDGAQGLCRRFPPSVITIPKQNALGALQVDMQAQFPPMLSTGWCGEHQPKASILN